MRSALLFVAVAFLRAQTITTLADHGDPANRIDLVIVGDGYTAAQFDKFDADARRFIGSFFGAEVYKEYASYFNVRTIAFASAQSGASHPERNPPLVRSTAFGAAYNCAGVVRLICVDNARVNVAVNALLPASQRDFVIVLVNDPEYGGAGGALMVASTHADSVEIGLHESGHAIGLLADEYTDQPPTCRLDVEPPAANSTRVTDRTAIKWAVWIAPTTAVPTLLPTPSVPGLFEGAEYCPTGKYRPTYNSKMRALGNPFEAVNAEQLVRRFYNYISGIDGAAPAETSLIIRRGAVQQFQVATLQPATHALTVTWLVDGAAVGSGALFTLDTAQLAKGVHTVRVLVQDATGWVRNDPSNLLSDIRVWNVEVTPSRRPPLSRITGATAAQ